jgi:putative ABC transport system permease protein
MRPGEHQPCVAGPGVTPLTVPAGTLIAQLVVAALVGVLAVIGPARRAGQVDVLRAVSTE